MRLIGTALDQKPTGEDGSHRVGCRTALWKERRNHHFMISERKPKYDVRSSRSPTCLYNWDCSLLRTHSSRMNRFYGWDTPCFMSCTSWGWRKIWVRESIVNVEDWHLRCTVC